MPRISWARFAWTGLAGAVAVFGAAVCLVLAGVCAPAIPKQIESTTAKTISAKAAPRKRIRFTSKMGHRKMGLYGCPVDLSVQEIRTTNAMATRKISRAN